METRFRYRNIAGFLYTKYFTEGEKSKEIPTCRQLARAYLIDCMTATRLREIATEHPELLIHIEAGKLDLTPTWLSLDVLTNKERDSIIKSSNPRGELQSAINKKIPKYSHFKTRKHLKNALKPKNVTAEMNQANWYGV